MSGLDYELSRLRVDLEMKEAIEEAARRQGITVSAWRKVAYAHVLDQQTPGWRTPQQRGGRQRTVADQRMIDGR